MKHLLPILLLGSLWGLADVAGSTDAKAGARYFSCVTERGVPITMATMESGKQVPVIRWVSDAFTGSGWSPQRRCQEVSERFTSLSNQGLLNYLTTGSLNGMSVICAALNKGDGCTSNTLLYTLKPEQNPTQTLRNLLVVRTYAVRPLDETGGRLFIDLNEVLGLGPSTSMPARSTGDALWKW
jgi:hypothetical protein